MGLVFWQVSQKRANPALATPMLQKAYLPAPVIFVQPFPNLLMLSPKASLPTEFGRRKVRVLLFSEQPVFELSIAGEGGLVMDGYLLHENAKVEVAGEKVRVRSGQIVQLASKIGFVSASGQGLILKRTRRVKVLTTGDITVEARKGHLFVVNRLNIEDYVAGIVEPEIGSLNFPVEALKAQLIAARSYALAVRDRHARDSVDFCDSAHCQVYAARLRYPAQYCSALTAVKGVYLRYKGRPAAAFFHHSCGGSTAAVEEVWPVAPVSYLQPVKDNARETLGAKGWEWSFTVDRSVLVQFLVHQKWLGAQDALETFKVIQTDRSGRAKQILLQGNVQRWIRARSFRALVNTCFKSEVLPSMMFTITLSPRRVRFDGRGWGHGVGLCQAGSVYWARHGQSYQDILRHYYPGTDLARLSN